MPKTVNTGFVCFKKASSVRTPNFFSSQAQSFTNKYTKKKNIAKNGDAHISLDSCTFCASAVPCFDAPGDGLKGTYDRLVFSYGSRTHTIILGL